MKKSGESTSDEVDQSTCSSLFDADRYGICQSFTALFVKCWLVFFRKPLQACFVILSPTVLVLINYGVDAYNLVGQLPRDGFNSCGGPVRADSDYYARVNPFFSSILSFGPLVSMLIAISYIQEESKNGVLFLARWSHKLQSLFWLSWWCLFLLSSFASSLLAAAVAKALPDFFYRHCSFGSLFAPLFLLQLAVLFGFSFLVNLCSGFSGKPGVQALLIVLLFGSYFLAGFAAQFSVDSTREGSIGVLDDYDKGNPAVTIPRTTNTSRCVLEPVEHVLSATASGASNSSGDPQACLEFEICLAQLLLEDGVEYWGCWYEASATETMWAPMNAGQVLRLVALVFFPTFHFANIMDEITSIIMMNQSNFDGLEMFFDSMPEAISKVLGFSNQQHLAAYGIDNTQLLTRANRASNVPLVSHCNTKYAYEIPPGGIVGSAAPSYGASLGYLALLAVVYAIGTLVSTRVRFEIGLKRISIASNKRSKRSNRDDSQEGSSSLPSSASAQSLVLENISMMYPGAIQQNKSLDSISLTLSPGQVVALCGRNGAGKSTLLNILAGKLVPSEGSITVGEAIQSTKVGFCFQQDKLYKELSAEEHLLLYARIRGIPPQHVKARVKQWLQETNLYSKRHAPMQALSGGMRRRLSVGLATIGTEGGLVLLDEPSTAVDPVNRRYIWKHIDNVKRDRIVLSSSHSMDEVEVLGDRVLILDRGKILTDDSPFQLKVKYGDILQLTLYCNLVYIPSIVAHIQDNFRARLAPYELHITAAPSGNIAVCIRSPPDDCDTHESSSCSVSTTPLVPPKQSKQPKPQQQQPQSTLASHGSSSTMVEEDEDALLPSSCQTIATNSASETGASSTSASFSSSQQDLLAVSARTERGDERTESKEKDGKEENDSDNPDSLASIVSELLEWIQSKESNIMEFGVSNTTFDQVFFRVLARHSSFGDRTPMGVPSLPPPSERPGGGPGLVRNELSSLPSSSHSEPMSTFIQVKDNERKALAVLSEQSQHLSGFRLLRTQIFLLLWLNLRTRMFSLEVVSKWVTLLLLIIILLVVETTSTHVMSDTLAVVSVLYILPSLLIPSLVFEINNGFLYFLKLHRCTFTAYASAEFIFSSWLFFLVSLIPLSVLYGEGETDLIYKHVEYLTCFSTPEHPCSCFVSQDRLNISALGEHIVPIATYSISSFQGPYGFVIAFAICYSLSAAGIVLGLSAAFRHYRIAAIVSASILLVFGALISFVYYNYAVSFSYTLPTDSGCVLIPNPMPRTVASSGIRTVGEDHGDCLSRTVQSASVAFDLILPIGLLMSLCSFFFFGTSFEQVEIHAPSTNASVVLPGDCTSTSQQTIAENVGFYFAGVCLWTILCLLLFRYKTFPTSKALSFRLNLLHFTEPCMSWLKKVLCSCKSLGSSQNGSSLMGSSMLSSAGLGSVMCVENERLRVQEHLRSLKQQDRTDVGETGTRRETDASPMPAAVLDDLSKVFHSKHGTTLALDKMNLLLPQGHIVCLLAPNGGGKSTCGALLMNKIDPTSGAAYIGGEDVSFHLNHVLQSIAYIPQDDLWYWPSSTVGQHLTLFAKLRGLTCSAETLDQVVSGIADLLDLTPHLKHKVGSLSGGTKRRLSLALVMLGTPFFAFLDEFSTGLDPITRRTSWACIEYFKAQFNCSMIITTQSMVEAETLSDRIVILTKGKAKAIDSPQGLKDRFGNGYTLLLSVEVEQRKEAFEYVRQTVCGQAVLGNFLNGILRIHFPRSGFCLPTAFKSLFSPRAAEHGILHWLLNQASIEDVFINLAGADEAKLEEIGYLNEAAHKIVVRLLRHQGFTNNQQQTNQ